MILNCQTILKKKIKMRVLYICILLFCCFCGFTQPANNNCSGAFSVPVNSGSTCVTTLTATTVGATQSLAGCSGNANDDVWLVFTATNGSHTITITPNTLVDPVLEVFVGTCAGLTSLGCVDAIGNTVPEVAGLTTSSGTIIYLRVYGYYNTGQGTFTACITTTPDPPGTNCTTGTQLCNNSSVSGNSSGAGSEELTATSGGCLGAGGEVNSHWFYVNVATSGTFEFTITPSNGNDDYDFAVWGPTNVCPPTVAPIRCNYAAYPRAFGCGTNTNPTGLSGLPGFTTATACQNRPYLDRMNVLAGEVYLLLVNGFTPAASSYNMSFGGTATLDCTPVVLLPVELLSFEAVYDMKSKVVNLDWKTASESNNHYFEVQRSLNGVDFEKIDVVLGGGNTTEIRSYHTTDKNAVSEEMNYYRLKQVDYNGQFKYSKIVAVAFGNDKTQLNVLPNPNNGKADVNFVSNFDNTYTLTVFDITGKVVYENDIKAHVGKNLIPMDLININTGLHFVRVQGNGELYKTTFVKE